MTKRVILSAEECAKAWGVHAHDHPSCVCHFCLVASQAALVGPLLKALQEARRWVNYTALYGKEACDMIDAALKLAEETQ